MRRRLWPYRRGQTGIDDKIRNIQTRGSDKPAWPHPVCSAYSRKRAISALVGQNAHIIFDQRYSSQTAVKFVEPRYWPFVVPY